VGHVVLERAEQGSNVEREPGETRDRKQDRRDQGRHDEPLEFEVAHTGIIPRDERRL
jgi:hypothetical protein